VTSGKDDDFAFEPIPGLPERPPEGEDILWQGAPDVRSLVVEAMRLKTAAVLVALMLAWRIGAGVHDKLPVGTIVTNALWTLVFGLCALSALVVFGWLIARGTVYTLTTRRLVVRHGVAMPMSINVPFSQIDGAAIAHGPRGTGTIALATAPTARASFLALWPHVRPFHVRRPQPALRCIADVDAVAKRLAAALAASPARVPAPTRAARAPTQPLVVSLPTRTPSRGSNPVMRPT
jgi:hypothetical protein